MVSVYLNIVRVQNVVIYDLFIHPLDSDLSKFSHKVLLSWLYLAARLTPILFKAGRCWLFSRVTLRG